MFNIGIFQFNENELSRKYVNELRENYKLSLLEEEMIKQQTMNELHAIIAFENDLKDITKLCELILVTKEYQNCYLFVISTSSSDTGNMVYLRLGCDYVFNLKEQTSEEIHLVIQNALMRSKNGQGNASKDEKITDVPLYLIHNNFSVLVNGEKEVSLTKLEYKALDLLAKKPNVAFSYEEIYEELYKNGETEEGKVKNYRVANIIFHLRKKIEEITSNPKYIKTVRTKGYMLDIQERTQ
ncbi:MULTISPECIES: winged helix-turn-helix domain-containing protein [unclassified Enterococcus]|uniref:winged helix-turn-helix domain-containing protein n=1 Tax=unclassified Enterococcus TaxID=2608891 RepID=UPI001CE1BC96|nr:MULTISPECIES: winged helix-turn-helix domain-containing protein [unclassified Enterococcus]MCA5012031.1 response regulator transcription factor [Enterococcus sp. S23]MCA5015282.1 response regulator transcription factor [Enterococcus sp. S22(2020)]